MSENTNKKTSQDSPVTDAKRREEKAAEFRRTLEERKKEAQRHSRDVELKDLFRQF